MKKIFLQCRASVPKEKIRRENIDGVEHIIINSTTLPDNIVMNGVLYPANEIESSYKSLEMTLAPVEHPQDSEGNYISAYDPRAIHNFHAGAFNANVKRENGFISIEKFINVQEAKRTDRGKRLLDRINEIETSESPRPIHTSVGVFLNAEELEKPMTNADGHEYSLVARNMEFDHDAILLDSVGAAKPSQGVGIAVNSDGEKIETSLFQLELNRHSLSEKRKSIEAALTKSSQKFSYIEEIFEDSIIYVAEENELFEIPYTFNEQNGETTLVGIALPVMRKVTYPPLEENKGSAMKDLILSKLKSANVDVEGMDDDAMLEAYDALQTNKDQDPEPQGPQIAELIANALKEQTAAINSKLEAMELKLNEEANKETERLAAIVANSGKYPSLDADSAKLLGVEKLKELVENCNHSYGLNPTYTVNSTMTVPVDMPE